MKLALALILILGAVNANAQSRSGARGGVSAEQARTRAASTAAQSQALNGNDSTTAQLAEGAMRRSRSGFSAQSQQARTERPRVGTQARAAAAPQYNWNFSFKTRTEYVVRDIKAAVQDVAQVSANDAGQITVQNANGKITTKLAPVQFVRMSLGKDGNTYLTAMSESRVEIIQINANGVKSIDVANAPEDLLEYEAKALSPIVGRVTVTGVTVYSPTNFMLEVLYPSGEERGQGIDEQELAMLMKATGAKTSDGVAGLSRIIFNPEGGGTTSFLERILGKETHKIPFALRTNEIFDTVLNALVQAKEPDLSKFSRLEIFLTAGLLGDQTQKLVTAVAERTGGRAKLVPHGDQYMNSKSHELIHPDLPAGKQLLIDIQQLYSVMQ